MQRADSGHYRVTVQPKWQHNLGPILAQFLHHWSVVRIWVLFWFILWLRYLRFSEARFGSSWLNFLRLYLVYFGPGLAEKYGPIYLLAWALILVRVQSKTTRTWSGFLGRYTSKCGRYHTLPGVGVSSLSGTRLACWRSNIFCIKAM